MMNKHALLAVLHRYFGNNIVKATLKAFKSSTNIGPQEIVSFLQPLLSPEDLAKLNSLIDHDDTLKLLEKKLYDAGVTVITMHDALYPDSLLALRSPPPLLYVKGNLDKVQLPGIGICGSRKASKKGLEYAERFGQLTATLGVPEISGYAQGIDVRAHLGALKSGGMTVAVLAEGILRFRHKKVFNEIADLENRMMVLSEFHPERPWHVSTAMQRNRTICGLSEALVVVEANDSGGTLDAGGKCLEQKKPLLVIQYGNMSEMPRGNLQLIRKGGTPVNSYKELTGRLRPIMSGIQLARSLKNEQSRLPV